MLRMWARCRRCADDINPPGVLHVACAEPVSVAELAALVAAGRDYAFDARARPLLTVGVGGPLCVDAALSALDWKPTPVRGAVRRRCVVRRPSIAVIWRLADGEDGALREPEPKRDAM